MTKFVELKIHMINHWQVSYPKPIPEGWVPKYETFVIKADRILEFTPRKGGYQFPMCSVLVDMGTRGHWEAKGANSVTKTIEVYNTYDELKEALL